MRYLIDTNVLVNLVENGFISDDIRYILSDYSNQIYICSECIKEFMLLVEKNKVQIPREKQQKINNLFEFVENELAIQVKYIAKEHLKTFAKINPADGHNDPSDRLIIAQAITEKIPIISSDKKFSEYRKQGLEFIPNY